METQTESESLSQNGGEPIYEALSNPKGTSHSLPNSGKLIRILVILIAVLLVIALVGEFASRKGWTKISKINGEKLDFVSAITLAPDGDIWVVNSFFFDG